MINKILNKVHNNLLSGSDIYDGIEESQREFLLKRYSEFIDVSDSSGFLIESGVHVKTLHTPRPYLHLMASNHYDDYGQWGSFWDQHRGGFSCVDTVMAGRMSSHLDTNYVPTSPFPTDVREFFIHEAAKAWPIFPVACYEESEYQGYSCKFGLDTYDLFATRNSIKAHLKVAVHPDMPLEVWKVTLKNTSNSVREFSWFSRIRINIDSYPFYYFVPRVVCHGCIENGALVFINSFKFNKHPRSAFFACDTEFDGFDMMQESFQGIGGRSPIPAAVQKGNCHNTIGRQPYDGLIAACQFNAKISAGKKKTWTFAFGKCPCEREQRKIFINKVKKEILKQPEFTFNKLRSIWHKKINANIIDTPDNNLNRYYNVWSKYQARNQARFIRALDKVGYRDIVQDIMGVVDFEWPYVRAKLIETMRYQYPDGKAVRQYEKHHGGGHDVRQYQDSVVWLPDTTVRYLKQSGDFEFLEEQVGFLDPHTFEVNSMNTASVYEHLCLAIDSLVADPGHHGLCKIGHGDWNDSLSGIGGKMGVSVWLSCACVYACNVMAELAESLKKTEDAVKFKNIADILTKRINDYAWDGRWYVYAINDDGVPIGSSKNEEGKIHLNVNTWALFTGVAANAGREQQVLESIAHLATPIGHQLLKPAYTPLSRKFVGRLADSVPGMIENASIYTHGEAFYLFALINMGRSDDWYNQLQKTLPGNLIPDLVTGPPHQQSNYFVGPDSEFFGQNMFNNFTGSLAWYRIGIEQMLGVIPDYYGLKIEPSPPSEWKEYRIRKHFRGIDVKFNFKRTGTFKIYLDGEESRKKFISVSELENIKNPKVQITF